MFEFDDFLEAKWGGGGGGGGGEEGKKAADWTWGAPQPTGVYMTNTEQIRQERDGRAAGGAPSLSPILSKLHLFTSSEEQSTLNTEENKNKR